MHKHFAAMHMRDGFDDGQPQTVVGPAVMPRGIHPVKALKQPWQVFIVNGRAWVADADADVLWGLFNVHIDPLARFGVLHRIVQQVNQRPAQVGLFDIDLSVTADPDVNLGVLQNELQVIQRGGDFVSQ